MGKVKSPGLFKRNSIWHIDKQIDGCRLRESTGAPDLFEAERYLAKRTEEIRQASVYGVRPNRTFREAAIKYLKENQHKSSIHDDGGRLKKIGGFIGKLPINAIHMGSLQPYIETRKKEGVKMRTINQGLKIVRRILNLAASEWLDEHGLTWLLAAPKIKLLPEPDLREPYPMSWEEQERFFTALPKHLQKMALFAVHTGCRDGEICNLKWEWEVEVPELNTSVFIIPGKHIKNRHDKLIVLNDTAQAIVNDVRGIHPEYVFTYRGHSMTHMLNNGWTRAREETGIDVRVHDLRHTFGRRLRAAGVSYEDRQDLLGHKSSRITTHYSAGELSKLLEAANKVCCKTESAPTLTVLKTRKKPHIFPTMENRGLLKNAVSY